MDTLLEFIPDANNNSQTKDKYSLRPRSMRVRTTELEEPPLERPKQTKKQKQKAAPLSKYRRKTANARERNRMREINQAFETLRKVIPHMQVPQVQGANEKLTKITTLRLAMKYIQALSSTLNEPMTSLTDYSDLDWSLLESDGESLPLSDNSFLGTSPDFPDTSLSPVDFSDPCLPALLQTDFTEHSLVETDDLSEFLLT